ncbi:MAG: GNAT family N-acetyltransferase [Chloroflexi bacterium]|nr:GNAT family N-acetyltransferase [Chloroflexota bacterium]
MTARPAFRSRSFGPDDLDALLTFVGRCNAADFCCTVHPGDVRHFMSNIRRGGDVSDNYRLFEDETGSLAGLLTLYGGKRLGFEWTVMPDEQTSPLVDQMVAVGEAETLAAARAAGADSFRVEVLDCDHAGVDLLKARGFTETDGADNLRVTLRSLESIPEPVLPEGFTIRAVTGESEADAVGQLHASAFGSRWDAGEYVKVMRSPAFQVDHELVAVALNGDLAAFLVYWVDPISRSGLFEPVGCGQAYQRRGLTRALLYEGMRRMAAEGAVVAQVKHESPEENPASAALYASAGFMPFASYRAFVKSV